MDELDKEVFNNNKPVVVDFYADWCGPCKMIAPILENIATNRETEVDVVKINVDNFGEIAMKYGIMSIPTLMYFKSGEPKQKTVGYIPENEINAKIDNLVNS
ncbi:MAG: thioredoxin [Bacillota bacterium]|nr:thioredoxin [Bacillota bacterium]